MQMLSETPLFNLKLSPITVLYNIVEHNKENVFPKCW